MANSKASIIEGPLPAEFYVDYVDEAHIADFEKIVHAPVEKNDFISSKSDWRPVRQKVAKRKKRRPRKDETREGFVYTLLSWPLLFLALGWIGFLGLFYFITRIYIFTYEHWITWRGVRNRLRRALRQSKNYEEWKTAAINLDNYLGGNEWKESEEFSYYDFASLQKITKDMRTLRDKAQNHDQDAIETLSTLVRGCVKNNFAGTEDPRLYSETYYGTKQSLQEFNDELETSLQVLLKSEDLKSEEKHFLFKGLQKNLGRSALCLSGGACFAYYHFGVVRAHLDANLIPTIITGTSGGGLIAALVGTRTDAELKEIMIPAIADKITACREGFFTWSRRWWKTGARFDSVNWAKASNWFTRGSMTFKEAFERTGRVLNISCVPNDPNSPSILLNYITAPDCVIWTALLASAAVPGILNPVVLMMKTKKGNIIPYSFGHKWKDGSIRTDIPLQSLNLHFNVNFPIVSQVNPHITIFYFSGRGTVGRPVSHRRGRGWRGGYLGSAVEQYLKLDLTKWLKVVRHLELLPRPFGTDWSNVFLQKFYGSVNILPKTKLIDYYYILSDPSRERMAWMFDSGEHATYPKLKFISNRLKLERIIEEGRRTFRSKTTELETVLSSEDIASLLRNKKRNSKTRIATHFDNEPKDKASTPPTENTTPTQRFSPRNWWNNTNWPAISEVLTTTGRESNRRWSLSPLSSLPVNSSSNNDNATTSNEVTNGDASTLHAEEPTPKRRSRFFDDLDSGGDAPSSTTWTEEDTAAEDSTDEGDHGIHDGGINGGGIYQHEDDDEDDDDDREQLEIQLGVRKRRPFETDQMHSDDEEARGRHDIEYYDDDREEGEPGKVEYIQAGPS